MRAHTLFKNFSYSLAANLLSYAVSAAVLFILPRYLGVASYGYYQFYILCASFAGLAHFGWLDGIYLRYGGMRYDELDRRLVSSQFWTLIIIEFLVGSVLFVLARRYISDAQKLIVISFVVFLPIIENSKCMLSYIMQVTNRISCYARTVMLDRMVFLFNVCVCLLFGFSDFRAFLVADVAARAAALCYITYQARDITTCGLSSLSAALREGAANITSGAKLLFANIAAILVVGIVRFFIEHEWDISAFSQVSLALSASFMLSVFVNAAAIVLYPHLKMLPRESLAPHFAASRDALDILAFAMLFLYYPLVFVLLRWLPQYAPGIAYISMLFPLLVYESKRALLLDTYLKAIRAEGVLFLIHVFSLALSFSLTYIAASCVHNLALTAAVIPLVVIVRSVFEEVYLSRVFKISYLKNIAAAAALALVFASCGASELPAAGSAAIYFLSYCVFLALHIDFIRKTISFMRTPQQVIRKLMAKEKIK